MDLKSLKNKLTGKVRNIMSRLSGKTTLPTASGGDDDPALQFAFSDPTQVSYPSPGQTDEARANMPLSMLLEKSAHNMVIHGRELRDRSNLLVSSIGARAGGEITFATQSLRFIIGGIWLLTAIWLYLSGSGALLGNGSALSSGMPAADAMVLSTTFLKIGVVGIGAAMLVAALVSLSGNGTNDKVRQEAHELGLFIADTAQEFDDDLTHMREEMNRRGNPADAVVDLSHAHLTALEATAYFREISFLTGSEGEEAKLRFRHFLSRPSKGSMIEGFIFGALFSAIVTVILVGPKPELPEVSTLPDIAKYPWASNLLLYGGILYALAGLLVSLAGGAISAGAVARAREDALASLRGAFTSREAPRPADVTRRIEDAVDVFRARVGGRRPDSAHADHQGPGGAHFGEDKADSETPSWRKRDSSAQFVESGFQSAPQTWRADAYAKKFATSDRDKPGSKRGLLGLKKPSSD